MDGSEEESRWERSSASRGLTTPSLGLPPLHRPNFDQKQEHDHHHHSNYHHAESQGFQRWTPVSSFGGGGVGDRAAERNGDVSLREWLDRAERVVDLVECLHIFRQIVQMVSLAHGQGIVVNNIRPSCFIMSDFNRVSFIESASCSSSDSGSDSCGEGGSDGSPVANRGSSGLGRGGGEEKKKAFPMKQILVTEFGWYTSPEEAAGGPSSFPSDIYRLGILLFELSCTFSSLEEKFMTMSNLRHRVLPPQLLLKHPKEASFCLWLLHPQPSSRPKMSEVLKSEFLNGPWNSLQDHEAAIKLREEIEDQDLLMEFLLQLQRRKQEAADKLHDTVCCLSSDIEEVAKKHSTLRANTGSSFDLVKDEKSSFERENQTLFCPERTDNSVSSGSKKRFRPGNFHPNEEEATEYFSETLGSEVLAKNNEHIISKSSRLMKNFKKLESAYFITRCRMIKPGAKAQNRHVPASSVGKGSVARTEGSTVDNSMTKEVQSSSRTSAWISPFLEGLCKYLSYSKFNIRADLKQGDLLSSSNLVCSLGFDRDKELFATAGVNKKIKIFECDSILNEDRDMHYPVVEMAGKSKFSSICWNGYIKSQIASSDFEGVVQVWDVSRSKIIVEMKEHQRRVWSVDFSQADPTKLASGSDDGSVKLWNINQAGSIGTIKTKANVCSVQFPPDSSRNLAIGSADHRIYCYDIRNLKLPWCTLIGHSKTVSYVKFLDSSTLVSSSTDNSIKLWDLSMTTSRVLDNPLQTFTGHTNVKNFVGLSVSDGYIATGSETNEVVVYHKAFPMPVLSYNFNSADAVSGGEADDTAQFISCVCWRGQSSTLVAANSTGNIKVLDMV